MSGREDPRVVRSRACILAAASRALEEEGAAGVTVEGVAERAGVAKTTVYRLWADRNELLIAAFEQLSQREPVPPTAELRADLIVQSRRLAGDLRTEAWGRALPALMDRAERDAVMDDLCRQLSARRRAGLVERFELAIERGELRTDADAELLASQLLGPIFFRRFVSRQTISDAELVELVDRLLASVSPASPRPGSGSGGPVRSPR